MAPKTAVRGCGTKKTKGGCDKIEVARAVLLAYGYNVVDSMLDAPYNLCSGPLGNSQGSLKNALCRPSCNGKPVSRQSCSLCEPIFRHIFLSDW